MSVSQIPNLTPATTLGGSEQLEAVQAGSTVRVTAAQIAAYTQAQYPVSTISSVTATSPLYSSTLGTAVTISLPLGSVTNSYLASMPNNTLLGNFTGGTSSPVNSTVSTALDSIGSAQGGILYRGASNWAQLGAGSNGYVLTSSGSGGAPYWANISLGTMATQNANAVAITGGTISGVSIATSTINQTPIGGTTPSTGAFTNLSASGTVTLGTITGATWQGNPVAVTYGGTGASTASGARTNLGAAASGVNSDITSLTGLTIPLSETQGGTGYGSYTTGDILYAASSTTLARLNDVATGNALISGGVGTAPSWGKIGLATHVSGTLPVTSGGTGQASILTQYGVIYASSTSAMAVTAAGTTGQILTANTGSFPTWTNGSITIGSTNIVLGTTASTISGLTTLTLTQDPTAALQASTKQYVDTQVATYSNTTFHAASSYATTGALSANYSNGTGGVGATLTNSGALAALTIDGYTFTATDVTNSTRVLIKDQASSLQNGIYTVSNQGSGSTAWVLTRAADFNTVGTGPNYIETGAATFISNGSANSSTSWVMNTYGSITVGSTGLTWAQISATGSITVTSPLTKVGSVISLGTVTVPFGGTGLTTLTQYSVVLGNGTGNVTFASPGTSGYALLSTGSSSNPAFGQLSLTSGVTGTLPVANGGTGTATAFTTGSVVFAGASGVYSQNNAKFFWDNTNNRLGINTAVPQTQLTIVSNSQTVTPTAALPAGTDIYIVGANAANTRITQDAYGTGSYGAYTSRSARGTAASPTASQSGDTLSQFTGRGYGATGFATASTGYFQIVAGENFTDTAQGTYASIFTTVVGANSAAEAFRFGTAGQLGIGGATYGTSGYVLTSGGASAAPTWSQVSATSLTGILPVANGGTGLASWTTGSLVYASGTTTLAGLADAVTGNALISGGAGVAPSYGKIGLTTHVSGTLPIANGGTNLTTTPTDGQLLIGSTSGAGYALATLTAGTNVSITNGAGSISIAVSGNPSFATSITSPLVIGGTSASSSLTLQSTSGVGTSDSILFKVGNNGATTAMTISTAGLVTANNFGSSSVAITGGAINGTPIGASTASTGAFTTVAASTSVTSPLQLGGTAASSTLTLQSTSGVGTTDSILFKVGNNGATTAMSIATGGTVTIGTLNLTNALGVAYGGTGLTTTPANGVIDIGNGSGFTRSTLTAGTNISVSNGSGSITLATTANPTFSTSVTSPLHIGGTTASSTLTLQSTSGVGTSDSILFKTGNNGSNSAMTIDTNGNVEIGTSNNSVLDGVGGTRPLIVQSSSTATTAGSSTNAIVIVNSDTTTNNLSQLNFAAITGASTSQYSAAWIACQYGARTNGQYPTGQLLFATTTTLNSAPSLKMTLTSSGGLVVGSTTDPGAGNIADSIGNVRNVPQNAQTSAYVLVATDNGKHISITTGGVTVNSGIFSAGQSVTVYNNSSSSQTITQGTSVTMYLVGTATTGNRTLAQRGLCTIFCVASNTFVITGGGLT